MILINPVLWWTTHSTQFQPRGCNSIIL